VRHRTLGSLLLLLASVASAQTVLSPQAVTKAMASHGVKSTLQRLFDDQTQWSAVLAAIATGTRAWLDIANTFHAVADGAPGEQLESTIGEALEHRPGNVLAIAIPNFALEVVCTSPDVDDPRFDSYDLSMAAIERRQARLRSVREANLLALRDSCIAELEKAKGLVAQYYGRAH
jgi:hypothetical protein